MREHAIPFYAPINSQYEIFEHEGRTVKRAYMPVYPHLEGVNFDTIYNDAIESFESHGFEVRKIPFYWVDKYGNFRCASKVLERGKYNTAI